MGGKLFFSEMLAETLAKERRGKENRRTKELLVRAGMAGGGRSSEQNSRRKNINRPSPQTGTASPCDIEHHTDEVSGEAPPHREASSTSPSSHLPMFRFNQCE
jgi:hypothetical protein